MENSPPFYLTKIMDIGTCHPIIARISLGMSEIIDLWEVSKEKKAQTRDLCYAIGKNLIEAEKQASPVIKEIESIEEKLKTTNSNTFPKVIESVLSLDNTKTFLKFAKAALEKFANLLGLIFDKNFPKPKFEDIKTSLTKDLAHQNQEEYLILEILKRYQPFADQLISLRNREEHPHRKDEIFVTNYEIIQNATTLTLERPHFINKEPVLEYLKTALHNLLHFIEEALIASISINLPPPVVICEIPFAERNPKNPKRFRLGIAGFPFNK